MPDALKCSRMRIVPESHRKMRNEATGAWRRAIRWRIKKVGKRTQSKQRKNGDSRTETQRRRESHASRIIKRTQWRMAARAAETRKRRSRRSRLHVKRAIRFGERQRGKGKEDIRNVPFDFAVLVGVVGAGPAVQRPVCYASWSRFGSYWRSSCSWWAIGLSNTTCFTAREASWAAR